MIKLRHFLLATALWLCLFHSLVAETTDKGPNHFEGKAMPVPPKQNTAWEIPKTSLPLAFGSAVKTLFLQGLADPRGCTYRDIEVVTGNCWKGAGGVFKTRGWVLPAKEGDKQHFAVCWNGLVYPVVSVGDRGDVKSDVLACVKAEMAKQAENPGVLKRLLKTHATPEYEAITRESVLPIKAALLLRLGEAGLAEKLWKAWGGEMWQEHGGASWNKNNPDDPYLLLATDWTWYLFDRAVCAHMRSDDRLALLTCRFLSSVWESLEEEAGKRGFDYPYNSSKTRPKRFFPFLWPINRLLKDQERRAKATSMTHESSNQIASLIEGLDEVHERQWGQPGGVDLAAAPRAKALAKFGNDAIEPLLECLEKDDRLTRSVSFHRSFFRGRRLISVRNVAYIVLVRILKTSYFGMGEKVDAQSPESSKTPGKLAAQIRRYWARFGKLPLPERWYETLKMKGIPTRQCLQAAKNIVRRVDVEAPFGSQWVPVPKRVPGEKLPAMCGEILRSKTDPSVSNLMEKWINDLSSSGDLFDMHKACDLVLLLAKWDPVYAVTVLKRQIKRCQLLHADKRGEKTSWTKQRLVSYAAKFVTILAAQGDKEALADYAIWVRGMKPEEVSDSARGVFGPFWLYPDNPDIVKAVNDMFNSTSSPWNPANAATSKCLYRLTTLLESPLLIVGPFREHLLQQLDDKTVVGEVVFRDEKSISINVKNGWSSCGGDSCPPDDPLKPKQGTVIPYRVCDFYAMHLSRLEGTPGFHCYWPQAKRDSTIVELKSFLKQYGDQYKVIQLRDDYEPKLHLCFAPHGSPATRKQVAEGKAIFSLEGRGQIRSWEMPEFPMQAFWPSSNVFSRGVSFYNTRTKTGGYKASSDQKGTVWQAEELLENGIWKRYYGFVGPYGIAKVAAELMQFPGSFPWKKLNDNFDYVLDVSSKDRKKDKGLVSTYSADPPLFLTLKLRNRAGIDLAVPSQFCRTGGNDLALAADIDLSLRFLPYTDSLMQNTKLLCASRDDTEIDDPGWQNVTIHAVERFSNKDRKTLLKPGQQLTVFKVGLGRLFDTPKPGLYQFRVTLKAEKGPMTDQKTVMLAPFVILPKKAVPDAD